MARTVGFGSFKYLINLFDAVVTSVFRFGLGVWGVVCAQVGKLDDLFVEFVRWVFRFPRTTGKNAILSNLARRCAKCDSLYLAAVQLAAAQTTRNHIWKTIVDDLRAGHMTSTWFEVVVAEVGKRDLRVEVLEQGSSFVANRKSHAVHFAQYCFHQHTNATVGNNADLFRRRRRFGIFPFLFIVQPSESRFLLSFILHCWKFTDGAVCSSYPRICEECDQENSSFHVLFECFLFDGIRSEFFETTGQVFGFETLESGERDVCFAMTRLARDIFSAIRELCDAS
jgi:hypothetical protein